ncbi:endonuclease/exonuclease/phosphatase family protein [Candidatus Daviesbacteria bacterium]|nr:endonuclease/exonuclease/phosphatase family protein [Candidatus Daviesbacteria bacterium]
MKLISLNTWGGKMYRPLIQFIKHQSKDTDIFCFQEIYSTKSDKKLQKSIQTNLLEEIRIILPKFRVFYFPTLEGFDTDIKPHKVKFDLKYGSAIFVKDSIKITSHQDYFIYQDHSFRALKPDFSNLATPLQYISFSVDGREFSVFNFHGTAYPFNKLDSPNRFKETKKVLEIMNSKTGSKIIVGDFNLLPNTRCINLFEENLRNLIKEYNIPRTRSDLSPYAKTPNFQKFADYAFISSDINLKDFKVLEEEVSDHLPLVLDFT